MLRGDVFEDHAAVPRKRLHAAFEVGGVSHLHVHARRSRNRRGRRSHAVIKPEERTPTARLHDERRAVVLGTRILPRRRDGERVASDAGLLRAVAEHERRKPFAEHHRPARHHVRAAHEGIAVGGRLGRIDPRRRANESPGRNGRRRVDARYGEVVRKGTRLEHGVHRQRACGLSVVVGEPVGHDENAGVARPVAPKHLRLGKRARKVGTVATNCLDKSFKALFGRLLLHGGTASERDDGKLSGGRTLRRERADDLLLFLQRGVAHRKRPVGHHHQRPTPFLHGEDGTGHRQHRERRRHKRGLFPVEIEVKQQRGDCRKGGNPRGGTCAQDVFGRRGGCAETAGTTTREVRFAGVKDIRRHFFLNLLRTATRRLRCRRRDVLHEHRESGRTEERETRVGERNRADIRADGDERTTSDGRHGHSFWFGVGKCVRHAVERHALKDSFSRFRPHRPSHVVSAGGQEHEAVRR